MKRWLANILLKISDWLDSRRLDELGQKDRSLAIYLKQYLELRDAHNELVFQSVQPMAFQAPDWTADDAIAFAAFMKTGPGQALKARLQAMTATVCMSGCEDSMHTTHSAGIGAGWKECTLKLLEHTRISRAPRVEGANNEEAPQGEEQLLEQLSP